MVPFLGKSIDVKSVPLSKWNEWEVWRKDNKHTRSGKNPKAITIDALVGKVRATKGSAENTSPTKGGGGLFGGSDYKYAAPAGAGHGFDAAHDAELRAVLGGPNAAVMGRLRHLWRGPPAAFEALVAAGPRAETESSTRRRSTRFDRAANARSTKPTPFASLNARLGSIRASRAT